MELMVALEQLNLSVEQSHQATMARQIVVVRISSLSIFVSLYLSSVY